MKKRILFVNESLALAGGEKSLIALLSKIDSAKYEVDLQLFHYGRELDSFIPDYVNVLKPLAYSKYVSTSWKKNIYDLFKFKNWNLFKAKLSYSLRLKKGIYNNPEKAQLYWESVSSVIENNKKEYDVAIAYAQGIPTFYVVDKIVALKKITWVNVNVKFSKTNKEFQYSYYSSYDKIVAVSDVTKQHLKKIYPSLSSKYYTIYDMLDYKAILKMADLKTNLFDSRKKNILTVARLNKHQKGYDITLEACKILRDRGVNFHWYAIGEGDYKQEMEIYIAENNLEDCFTLLGTTRNPYPYFKNADLYVQTSRHEGFGLSIAEARLLNTPVVTTKFDTVFMQMVHEKNGLVVEQNPEVVAHGIERLIEDKKLYNSIVNYLQKEQKEDNQPLERFYSLID